ncbi:MAG: GAF domain-containing protein [Chloroflexi bacterium]|nr:GAF domain-containing protein [Chloroflexota bacterium]
MSLQTKISISVGLGLLGAFGLFGFLGVQALQNSIERTLTERLALAHMVARSMDQVLARGLVQLEMFAASEGASLEDGALEPEKRALSELFRYSGVFNNNVFLVDRAGKVLWSEPYDSTLIGGNLASHLSVAKSLRGGRSQVSSLVTAATYRGPAVSLATPIRNRAGEIIGAVGGNIDLPLGGSKEFIQPSGLGQTAYTEIVNEYGVVMATTRPDPPEAGVFEVSDHAERFATLIQQGEASVRTCHRCHEAERRRDILAFAPLTAASWGVAIRQAEEEALAPTWDLERRMIVFGGLAFVIALSFTWVGVRSIIRPVQGLTRASQRIAAGDLDSIVPTMGGGEIGVLARTFETMRRRLRTSYQEIEERTQDIERRNRELSALCEISRALTSTLDLDSLLKVILQKTIQIFEPAEAAHLLLHDLGSDQLVVRSAEGFAADKDLQERFARGEGIPGMVFERKSAALLTPNEVREHLSGIGDLPVQSAIGAPLLVKGEAIGSLVLYHCRQPRPFSEPDVRLLQALSDQMAITIDNARLYEEVQRKEQLRGQLLESIISTQEEERRRIARELHDEAGQALTALLMAIGAIEQSLPADAGRMRERMTALKSLTTQTMEDIDRLISDLRPALLDDVGLLPALRWYIRRYSDRGGADVRLQIVGPKERRLPGKVETALFRIIQEALTNVAKHAAATAVKIRIDFSDSEVRAAIEDNGKGFEVDKVMKSEGTGRGLGLVGMGERAAFLGGNLTIKSRPGRGTQVLMQFPVQLNAEC